MKKSSPSLSSPSPIQKKNGEQGTMSSSSCSCGCSQQQQQPQVHFHDSRRMPGQASKKRKRRANRTGNKTRNRQRPSCQPMMMMLLLAMTTATIYQYCSCNNNNNNNMIPAVANAYVHSPLFTVRPSPLYAVTSETMKRLARLTNNNTDVGQRKTIFSVLRRFNSTTTNKIVDNENDDDDDGSWLGWMSLGKRARGSAEIKMREAAELGGLPRSDRYSSRDWLHNTVTLPNSKILSEISSPCLAVTSWATILSMVYRHLAAHKPLIAAKFALPVTPHSLTVSALSLLLVFKTNSAYQRFAEGRKIWEGIVNTSRDLYRLSMLYEVEIGRAKRRRIQRLLAAFPYLLRHRIRPNLVMYRLDDDQNVRDPENSILLYQDRAANDLDPELMAVAEQEENEGSSRRRKRALFWVDKRTLPWRLLPEGALAQCASAQNRPLWVCDRMAQELRQVPDGPNFAARERLTLIAKVEKLSGCIGACERIHQTAVPLNYARHSLRALTLWLFTLPFSLVGTLGLCTGPVLFLISWLMFGVYQIGYSIEDPFQGTLRLSVLCDAIRRDVLADEMVRNTAFDLEPPMTLKEVENSDGNDEGTDGDDDDDEDYEDGFGSSGSTQNMKVASAVNGSATGNSTDMDHKPLQIDRSATPSESSSVALPPLKNGSSSQTKQQQQQQKQQPSDGIKINARKSNKSQEPHLNGKRNGSSSSSSDDEIVIKSKPSGDQMKPYLVKRSASRNEDEQQHHRQHHHQGKSPPSIPKPNKGDGGNSNNNKNFPDDLAGKRP